jgi:peptide/nickel transport system ATP-binding protein
MSERVPLLKVDDLSVEFRTRGGVVRALEHINLEIFKGETVGIVGESGSGKSVLSYAILGILDAAGRVTGGSAVFDGMDMLNAKESDLEEIRGREASMIFQSPRTSLNPIRKVGRQIEDILLRHGSVPKHEARQRAIEMLGRVRIPDPERRYEAYPFELSGGMCQRILIAMALACEPALLIADEPTTGLDVTTQATIMDLIAELGRRRKMATILITHDLGLAAEYCDRIVVMHAGHVVESAPTKLLFKKPLHPYTASLLTATPRAELALRDLTPIAGGLPDLRRADLPPCRFAERCPRHEARCDAPLPRHSPEAGHIVACWRPII